MMGLMMIKALIITHLWSLLIALVAWALQRDKGDKPGAYFPDPKVWLGLIGLCFLPGLMSLLPVRAPVNLPTIEIFETASNVMAVAQNETVWSINYLALYFGISLLLAARTLFRWARLQLISVTTTKDADVFTTSETLPPLTLSWPRRAIIVPEGLQGETAVIRHERAHMRHHDAEITLGLLIVRDLMLRSFGLSYLVRQWRLAIELRADRAATKILSTSERKDYAALLLNGLRSAGDYTGGRTLPCPTAHLTSTRHRSVKMRLTEIMNHRDKPRKRRWSGALLATAAGAGALGLMSANATANEVGFNPKLQGITYVVRVAPELPKSCPGLSPNDIKITGRDIWVDGVVKYEHVMELGEVDIKYDARADGSLENIRVIKSNHPCFEPNAKAAVAQWKTEPHGAGARDIAVKIKFIMTAETHEDLESILNGGLLDQP